MRKNVVIVFSPGFAANESDSTCIPALQQFILQLKKLKPELEIRVFSLHYPFKAGAYVWNGIQCYSFGGKNRGGPFAFLLRRKTKKCLTELIKTENVKAILSIWMYDCAFIGQQLMNELNVPHFCWMHGQDARETNKFVKRIMPKPEQVICISDILQKEFERNHGIRSKFVVDNGITEGLFPLMNNEEREIDVIGVGSLNAIKNFSLFIEVIAQLKKEFPNIRAKIIGDGEEREALKKNIDSLQLNSNIVLGGMMQHKEVLLQMSKAKILLHTSNYEGSSGVIMESLYSGCFVVSTLSISLSPIKNVRISSGVNGLAEQVALILRNKELKHERVIFNTMRNSAQKFIEILDL